MMPASQGTVFITGTNGRLGSAIVRHIVGDAKLASYSGVYAVRRESASSCLRDALRNCPPTHRHEARGIDLSSLRGVRRAAGEINERVARGDLPRIRALILNAVHHDEHVQPVLTGDGFEVAWQVNHLSNVLLALLLLRSMDTQHGRILLISSWTHDVADARNRPGPEYEGLRSLYPGAAALSKGQAFGDAEPSHRGFLRYAASKLSAVMFAKELANRIAADPALSKMSVMALDPGKMRETEDDDDDTARSPWQSAADAVRAVLQMDVKPGGLVYLDGTEAWRPSAEVDDGEKREDLWRYSVEAAGLKMEDTVLRIWE